MQRTQISSLVGLGHMKAVDDAGGVTSRTFWDHTILLLCTAVGLSSLHKGRERLYKKATHDLQALVRSPLVRCLPLASP